MKRPIWATLIAVVFIFFGLSSIIMGFHSFTNAMLGSYINSEEGQALIEEHIEKQDSETRSSEEGTVDKFKERTKTPAWFDVVYPVLGLAKIAIGFLFFYGCVLLLKVKEKAISFAYKNLLISIICALFTAFLLVVAGNIIQVINVLAIAVSVILDALALFFLSLCNKEAYTAKVVNNVAQSSES